MAISILLWLSIHPVLYGTDPTILTDNNHFYKWSKTLFDLFITSLLISFGFSAHLFPTATAVSPPALPPLLTPTNPFHRRLPLKTAVCSLSTPLYTDSLTVTGSYLQPSLMSFPSAKHTHTHSSPLRNFCSLAFEGFPRPRLRLAPPIKPVLLEHDL